MILIVYESSDISAHKVIYNLKQQNSQYILISEQTSISDIELSITNNGITLRFIIDKTIEFDSTKISAYWYRRGFLRYDPLENIDITNSELKEYLDEELATLFDFFHILFQDIPISVGSYKKININKLECLRVASNCGLKIPSTYIASSTERLKRFTQDQQVISKGISDILSITENDERFTALTLGINYDNISKLQKTRSEVYPSLLQAEVKKEFEIRTFVFIDQFYSMAIFSQKNVQTKIDYRNYDDQFENRCVPFEHSKEEKEKIQLVMKKLGLTTGSFDFIVPRDESELIFLEVNPDGQFDVLSVECNYPVEYNIAKTLSIVNIT